MSLRAVSFIDTSSMFGLLVTKHRSAWAPPLDGVEMLPLRRDGHDLPLLRDWNSAKAVLGQIRKLGPVMLDGAAVKFGDVALVRLLPGAVVPWRTDEGAYADEHYRLEVTLQPSPGAWLYSGGEQLQPPVGMLLSVNNRVSHSAVNFGAFPWTRLLIDVAKPTIE